MVEFLVTHGADVNLQNKEGETALQSARRNGKSSIVSYLIDPKNWGRLTPLHKAAAMGNINSMQDCLEYLYSQTKEGLSPLHSAAQAGQKLAVQETTQLRTLR